MVGEEAVEPHPAPGLAVARRPLGRVERVDVDVAAVAVGRVARAGVGEPVHGEAAVGELAVQVVEPAGVDPVPLEPQHRQRPGPVRDVQLPCALKRRAGPLAGVREQPLPRLQRPVLAVRRRARHNLPGERRAGVRPAHVVACDRFPVRRAKAAKPARVVEAELDLLVGLGRRQRIDGAPHQDVVPGSAAAVRDLGAVEAVDRDRDVGGIAVDHLAREGACRSDREQRDGEDDEAADTGHPVCVGRPPCDAIPAMGDRVTRTGELSARDRRRARLVRLLRPPPCSSGQPIARRMR